MAKTKKKGNKFFNLFSCFSKKGDKLGGVGEDSDTASPTSPIRQPSKEAEEEEDEATTEPLIEKQPLPSETHLTGATNLPSEAHVPSENGVYVESQGESQTEVSTTPTEMIEETKVLHMEDPPLAQPEDTEEQVKRDNDAVVSQTDTRLPGQNEEEEVQDLDDVEVEMPPSMEPIQTDFLPPPTTTDPAHDPTAVLNGIDVPDVTASSLPNGPSNSQPAGQVVESDGTCPSLLTPLPSHDVTSSHDVTDTQPETEETEEEANKRKYSHKRKYILNELWETEKDYVRDLGLVVDGYMEILKDESLEKPEGLANPEKQAIVFGNIHQIYEWHQETFSAEIEKCIEEPRRLGPLFIKYERRLHMYVKYCENKPKSEYIVAEYIDFFEELRAKMGHRLMLPDILIKPVQRITKYQLLLKDILKQTEKAGDDTKDLQRAVQVMYVVPKAANDMMNVGRLQGFTGRITAQGQLQLQSTLLCKDVSAQVKASEQKFEERRVFLFEQLIIISEELKKKKNPLAQSAYVFKNSMKVNKMTLDRNLSDEDPLSFRLNDRTPGSDLKVVIQAPDQETKENWVSKIGSILEMQGDFLRALQSPIAYQKELTKELSAPEFGSAQKSSLLRKTNSHPHHYTGSKSVSSVDNKRCKSGGQAGVPGSMIGRSATAESSSSCSGSPSGKADSLDSRQRNLDSRRSTPGAMGGGGGSPKSKPRNIFEGFRNTLRPKKTPEKASDSYIPSVAVSPPQFNLDGGGAGSAGDCAGALVEEPGQNEAGVTSPCPAQPAVSS